MLDTFAKHRTARWIDIHINRQPFFFHEQVCIGSGLILISLNIGRGAQLIIIRNVIINKYKTFISEQFLI